MTWHEDRWDDPEGRFLAFTLHDRQAACSLRCRLHFRAVDVERRVQGCGRLDS